MPRSYSSSARKDDLVILRKVQGLPWGFLGMMTAIACFGFLMLYSVAQGNFDPWASRQMVRFAIAIPLMLVVAVMDIRLWYQYAWLAFLAGAGLLVLTLIMGKIGGLGAQRWLSIGGLQFQPAEVAKIGLALAIARYYHRIHPENVGRLRTLIVPGLLIAVTAALVLKQPNLGMALIIISSGGITLFLSGVSWKKFAVAGVLAVAALPLVWSHMHGYQKQRVLTFLNPSSDPLGAGYNIIQSEIAIGSGGFWGKGFLKGTQSQLSFIPEKHTDFIFSTVAEEWGFVGGLAVIIMYGALVISGLFIAMRSHSMFGRLLAAGLMAQMFMHVFINIGMVMGMLPVVGVPLPLLSYGGTSLISTVVGLGFILNVHIHRDMKFS